MTEQVREILFRRFDRTSDSLLQWLNRKGRSPMSYNEFTIRISDAFKDLLIQRLSANGCLGMIENEGALVAYFPETLDKNAVKNDLALLKTLLEKAGYDDELSYDYSLFPEKDWNETWKKEFKSIEIGERFAVLPPWEEKRADRINLVIDPAMAFGTGHHETTRSCLMLMENYARKTAHNSFLDLGTGTGILAIAARKLGYQYVVGIDTDILAVDAAKENVVINQVPDVEILQGSTSELHEAFDVIAANLISGVLILIAPALVTLLNPGGIAILSGILIGQEDEVIEAIEQAGLSLREKYPDGKWVSLVVEQARLA